MPDYGLGVSSYGDLQGMDPHCRIIVLARIRSVYPVLQNDLATLRALGAPRPSSPQGEMVEDVLGQVENMRTLLTECSANENEHPEVRLFAQEILTGDKPQNPAETGRYGSGQ